MPSPSPPRTKAFLALIGIFAMGHMGDNQKEKSFRLTSHLNELFKEKNASNLGLIKILNAVFFFLLLFLTLLSFYIRKKQISKNEIIIRAKCLLVCIARRSLESKTRLKQVNIFHRQRCKQEHDKNAWVNTKKESTCYLFKSHEPKQRFNHTGSGVCWIVRAHEELQLLCFSHNCPYGWIRAVCGQNMGKFVRGTQLVHTKYQDLDHSVCL